MWEMKIDNMDSEYVTDRRKNEVVKKLLKDGGKQLVDDPKEQTFFSPYGSKVRFWPR